MGNRLTAPAASKDVKPINLRLAHYESAMPISEFKVDPRVTVSTLKALIQGFFMETDSCQIKYFRKWFVEVKSKNDEKRNVAIDDVADGNKAIKNIGIVDESVLFFDGPIAEGFEGVRALIVMLMADTSAEIQLLKGTVYSQQKEIVALKKQLAENQRKQGEKNKSISGDHNSLKSEVAKLLQAHQQTAAQAAALQQQQQQQHQQQQQSQAATVKQAADKHLTDCPNAPLKALWAALTSPPQSPAKDASVALEIINDGRCGLERMSTEADGPFTDQLGYTLNEGPKRDRIASPLKLAIFSQRQDIVAKIVDLGANVNGAEEGNRDTPLHVAAGTNNTQLIEYLVSKGAKVNTANKYGNTPLHRASANGQLQAIEKLLALGADKTLGGDNTPLRRFEEFHAKCKATDAEKAKIRDLLR